MDSSISRCFLLPVWWGPGAGGHRHDALQKSLLLSHSRNGPSARLVIWRNYLGFDDSVSRTKPGDLIRAHHAKSQVSEVDEIENENQSFLGTLLGKALASYVSSQLEDCGNVEVHIAGSNQDIFRGEVKKVKITAKQAVYKGISISDVDISATSIRVKLGRKRLLQDPVQVKASISIGEEDLKLSLESPLLFQYLEEFLPRRFITAKSLSEVEVILQDGILLLSLDKQGKEIGQKGVTDSSSAVALTLNVKDGGQSVLVSNVKERESSGSYTVGNKFSVGSETNIRELRVADSRILIQGDFLVTP
ncbi:hypothetical protein Mapa_000357 [Marchantia paleacea]|nr:hypothetical protein Mapa_000357 [Marchantia paleacea]